MIRKSFLFAMLIMLPFTLKLNGQATYTYGNLVRVGFSQKEAFSKDTLGSWHEILNNGYYSRSYSQYFDHITTPGRGYFLKILENWYANPYGIEYSGGRIIENEDSIEEMDFFGMTSGPGWDIMTPYMINRTIVLGTKNGHWLISGDFGNAFLDKNGYIRRGLYSYPVPKQGDMAGYMLAILGKACCKYLASFAATARHPDSYNYYMVDLTDSPYIDSSKSIKVTFDNIDESGPFYTDAVTRIRNLTGDLYAVSKWGQESGLDIYRLKDTAFSYIKSAHFLQSHTFFKPWEFRNGKLYLIFNNDLESYDFNPSDISFINRKVLAEDLVSGSSLYYGIDRNFRYGAKLIKDTLKIFDVDNARFINSIYIGNIREPFNPLIDSPYVYLHQVRDHYTGVDKNKEAVVKSYILEAYPNPFNSYVKIVYSVPEDGHAELIVYDLMGQKVAELVNSKIRQGPHEILFNAKHLSSGIYLCTLRAGKVIKTNKIILMK